MHPVAYFQLVSILAGLVAVVVLIHGWKRPGYLQAIPVLILILLALTIFYEVSLFLEWSGLIPKQDWHFVEDFAGIFIPFTWAFVFYAFVKNATEEDLKTSREHFRNLVESTSDWTWEMDAAGRYTYVGPQIEHLLGYRPEELLGKTPFDFMPPEEAEHALAVFTVHIEKRQPLKDVENVSLHKDGHAVILETNGTPLFDRKGKLQGYRGIDRDITDRKAAEQVTRQRQAELDSIFTAAPVGIALIRDRRMVRGNQRFLDIAGYGGQDIEEIDARTLYLTQADYDAVGRKYEQARKEGRAAIETRWVRADNVIIDVVEYFAPLDADDPDKGYSVIVQDITELKAARKEAESEKSRAQLCLDAANVIILVLDTRGYVKLANKKCCEILGRSAEQIEGVDWFQRFLPTSYQQIARNLFSRIVMGDEKAADYFESPVCTPDGTEKLIAWRNRLLRDESGSITGVISSGLDITAERNAENALRDSDRQLHMALSAAKMGTWRWKAQTNLKIRSANLNALLGLPEEESTQTVKEFFDIVHPDDRVAAKEEFERAVRQQSAYRVQFRILGPDGQIRWMLDQGKPFFDFNGKLDYMTGVLVDVTDLKKAEQVLAESEARFRAVANYTYDWETWVNPEGETLWVNPAVERMTGYSVAECMQMEDYPLPIVHEEDRQRVAGIMKEALAGSSGNDQWFRIKEKNGSVRWGAISWQPIYDEQDQSLGYRSSVRDITDRKGAEQEHELLMQQLKERNDELQSIVFTAAHDFRSPLVNIAGFSDELEKSLRQLEELHKGLQLDKPAAEQIDDLMNTDIPESLGLIRSGSQHMDTLLNGLMRLSVVGAAHIEFSEVDLKKLLDKIIGRFRYRMKENTVDISVADDLPNCMGDGAMLTEVFGNLIDNAIKYRHPDRPAVVEINASIQDDMVEYTVADNGIGIEAEHLEKVFELFHRLHPQRDQNGQGLGLTIVRRILDCLHGSVRIESVPEQGTTVRVRLPKA